MRLQAASADRDGGLFFGGEAPPRAPPGLRPGPHLFGAAGRMARSAQKIGIKGPLGPSREGARRTWRGRAAAPLAFSDESISGQREQAGSIALLRLCDRPGRAIRPRQHQPVRTLLQQDVNLACGPRNAEQVALHFRAALGTQVEQLGHGFHSLRGGCHAERTARSCA